MPHSTSKLALASVLLLALSAPGCREDSGGRTIATGSGSAATRAARDMARASLRRMSPQLQKQLRMDSCFFGTLLLLDVRESYERSLGGAEPGPGKLPDFGWGAWQQAEPSAPATTGSASAGPPAPPPSTASATARASGAASAAPATSGAPNAVSPIDTMLGAAVRACTAAKRQVQPPAPELDAAIASYEPAVTSLHKLLVEAHDYYGGARHRQDDFRRGKELHAELGKAFADLPARSTAVGSALEAWRKQLAPSGDELDTGAKLAAKASDEARAATVALLATAPPSTEAWGSAVDRVAAAREALAAHGKAEPECAQLKLVMPELDGWLALGRKLRADLDGKTLAPATTHQLAARFARLVESTSRAQARARGGQGPRLRPGRGADGRLGPDGRLRARPIQPVTR